MANSSAGNATRMPLPSGYTMWLIVILHGNKEVFMNDMSWSCYYLENGRPRVSKGRVIF